ncbi:MAG TPA: Ig-like domain-containing protein, partial [Gemmatimonadaceae bacterium]|nr:Ig-like domain-containing protein [Gemmatimonadaceae bacterium]
MRIRLGSAAYVALALAFLSCSDSGPLGPVSRPAPQLDVTTAAASALPPVRVSEFHYDNAGADIEEKIEISGPTGTSLTGWTVVLYNGNGGAPYDTLSIGGAIPATCGQRGVIVIPANGLQNGSPDGFVLVDAHGAVVEAISYEGSFTATSGVAAGMELPDIGVRELGTESANPVTSLKRDDAGVWSGPAPRSFDQCNPLVVIGGVTVTPAAASIARGTTSQFIATATTDQSVPAGGVAYTWSSSDPAVATIDANGLATGLTTGHAMIIAAAPNGVADTSSLHVGAAPPPPGLPETRFSEIHYDNTGTDIGEKIEIEGPAGKDVTGWTIILYDGNGGASY